MKKSVLSFISAGVVGLSAFAVYNYNTADTYKVYSISYSAGEVIEIQSGSCKTVQFHTSRRLVNITTDDNDLLSIVNVLGSENTYYTQIQTSYTQYDRLAEIRAYFSATEYKSIYIMIKGLPQATTSVPKVTTTTAAPVYDTSTTTSSTCPCTTITPEATTSSACSSVPAATSGDMSTTSSTRANDATTTSAEGPGVSVETSTSATKASTDPDDAATETSSIGYTFYDSSAYLFTRFGDVDLDGTVDMKDLTVLSMYLIGDIKELNPASRFAADVIPSANITPDIADLAHLKQYLMKENVTLGVTDIIYI
ncbi:MAG: hypothetical protein Q4F95_12995 [Oscillospiraceae bacterium]|nr:hypothetical protein [Oscillospiraceae bacterium]